MCKSMFEGSTVFHAELSAATQATWRHSQSFDIGECLSSWRQYVQPRIQDWKSSWESVQLSKLGYFFRESCSFRGSAFCSNQPHPITTIHHRFPFAIVTIVSTRVHSHSASLQHEFQSAVMCSECLDVRDLDVLVRMHHITSYVSIIVFCRNSIVVVQLPTCV